jgi:predicted ATP-grasp superfamily ATP-dependent carboligase
MTEAKCDGDRQTPGAVLLGSDYKALGVIRSLARQGIRCVVVDDRPRAAWFSRYVTRRFAWPGAMWGPSFVDFLLSLAHDHGYQGWVLFPLQDEVVEVVARETQRLQTTYRLSTQPWETLRFAQDKRLAYQVADEVQVATPRTWYPSGEQELATMAFEFPAIVKPAHPVRLAYAIGRKVLQADDRAALIRHYRTARSVLAPDHIMVQDVIPGDGRTQYAVGAFCHEGGMLAAVTARRTRQYPYDYGLASSFVEAIEVSELLEPARRLIARLGLSGMVEVEFKHDRRDGRWKFLDINPRAWGWLTLCIACGLDFPYAQYRYALQQPITLPPPRYGYRWRRLVTDIPAGVQEIRHGWTTPGRYLRSLVGRSVPSVFDWRDPLPVLGDVVGRMRKRHVIDSQKTIGATEMRWM